jgi:serine/threonine protein phosphatase PrpC/serine/threonine protein kinase
MISNDVPRTCLPVSKEKDVETQLPCTALENDSQYARDRDSWWKWWFAFGSPWWRSNQQSEYTTSRTAFAGGSHGQVWKGRRVCDHRSVRSDAPTTTTTTTTNEDEHVEDRDCDEDKPLILKRLNVEQRYQLLEAGLREVYFGQWIRELPDDSEKDLFTSYVDHFFRELPRSDGSKDLELWIVFEDAGPSLRSYLYAPVTSNDGFVMYQHSPLWAQLRMTARKDWKRYSQREGRDEQPGGTGIQVRLPSQTANHTRPPDDDPSVQSIGREMLRTVLKQIISAAAVLHEGGIVHRDIKPSNVMCVSDEPLDDLYTLSKLPNIHCRLGDFSSAWNKYTNDSLYTKGPSPAEQTDEYAPPEAYIDPQWKPFDERSPQSYDSWSIGVLALELLLGTPNVFSVDQRTTVLLTSKMKKEGASDDEVRRALHLAALSQFCIYVPSSHDKEEQSSWPYRQGDPLHKTAMAKHSCTMQDFHRALRARDPLGMGFDSSTDLLLHLIWQLLAWDPVERITAAEALLHPFFLSPDGTRESLDLIPGRHNALESQMLDPRLDFVVDDNVDEFVCPKCGRVFSDWHSCNAHATSRRHAKFCTYNRTHLPSCINTHSMLPAHPTSGYCDLQGRRPTIEDFHSIHLYPEIQFYGIFDGHTGNVASKYAASTLFDRLVLHLPELGLVTTQTADDSDWKTLVEHNVSRAYQETHESFLDALALVPAMDQSGTTATALLVTKQVIVLSSLGDSRAVLSSTDKDGHLAAIQLTIDHVASDPKERDMVMARGGRVSSSTKGLARVNGTLAITRSIGDAALAPVLSRQPHVISMKSEEIKGLCGSMREDLPCFIILASDGLWDVMTNQEAVDMVAQTVKSYDATDHSHWIYGGAFQEAAEVLAVDAFVRGSTDNIGVCVVAIV